MQWQSCIVLYVCMCKVLATEKAKSPLTFSMHIIWINVVVLFSNFQKIFKDTFFKNPTRARPTFFCDSPSAAPPYFYPIARWKVFLSIMPQSLRCKFCTFYSIILYGYANIFIAQIIHDCASVYHHILEVEAADFKWTNLRVTSSSSSSFIFSNELILSQYSRYLLSIPTSIGKIMITIDAPQQQ